MAEAERERARRVLIAEGSEPRDLERVRELFEATRIEFEVEEILLGEEVGGWRIYATGSHALRARLALLSLPAFSRPAGSAAGSPHAPPPGPLFESRSPEYWLWLLALLCFALAAWLLRSQWLA